MKTEISTNTAPARGLALADRSNDAADFGSLVSMGDQLRRTGFLPSHIKDGVSFAAIVLMGREMGMGTMAACRKLQVIKGTVTERADSQLARFKSCGGRAQFKELTETRAVLVLRHPNGDEHTETFTLEDAKRAGLASNDNYAKHPKAMLRSRAITAGLKSIGWEGAVGIYDPDEIQDSSEAPAAVSRAHETARATQVAQPSVALGKPEATEEDMYKARLAISRAKAVARLQDIKATVEQRIDEGFYTSVQASELFDLVDTRIDLLGDDAGQEFPHEAAEHEVAS